MSRIPVSLVVTAGGTLEEFRAAVNTLRPTLGLQDEVVCVVPAARADLAKELQNHAWLHPVHVEAERQEDVWRAGLAETHQPVVVFLDGDVLVSAHWLEQVATAMSDPDVVAAGPCCHLGAGPQGVELPPEARRDVTSFQKYARQWRQDRSRQSTVVDRLAPVCFAVRRDALDNAGGPTLDLPFERLRAQGKLMLVDGALIAHLDSEYCSLRPAPPSPIDPLLSACLIVRDEEDVLGECLDAAKSFADEIVVYDTGSTDRTVEIAREYGAVVVEGYWDEHFGDARNRALARCTGVWAMVLDADEIVVGDPHTVRDSLRQATATAFHVPVDSHQGTGGTGAKGSLWSTRIFRTDRYRYVNRLHEQVTDRFTGEVASGPRQEAMRVTHFGYTAERLAVKEKHTRNTRLAELATTDHGADASTLMNFARAASAAGHWETAIDACTRALAEPTTLRVRVLTLKTLIEAQLCAGHTADAREALQQLRVSGATPITAAEPEARICFAERDFQRALAIVQTFPDSATDDANALVRRENLAEIEIKSLFFLNRKREAATRLRECLRVGQLPMTIAEIADALEGDGSTVREVAELFPAEFLRGLLFSVAEAPGERAGELLDALWDRYGEEPVLLAFAAQVGAALPVVRALEWSVRLRRGGMPERCTLLALAESYLRTPRERALAAATAVELFKDDAALPLLERALSEVPDEENALVFDEMRILAPDIAAAIEQPAGVS
jgi:tetratricopeptide (TPR) repeat protein